MKRTPVHTTNLVGLTEAAAQAGITPRYARSCVGAYLAANKTRTWPRKVGKAWIAPAELWPHVLARPDNPGGRKRQTPSVDDTRSTE